MNRRTTVTLLALGVLATACGTRNAAREGAESESQPSIVAAASSQGTASPAMPGEMSLLLATDAPASGRAAGTYTYNPAEGTVSQGDVWRVTDGGPVPSFAAMKSSELSFRSAFGSGDVSFDALDLGIAEADKRVGADRYAHLQDSPFSVARVEPLSTFSIDVDTAAYSNVRRFLNDGQRPPADAVRIEEMVNYFHYAYPQPVGDDPFSVNVETSECPWQPENRLVRIGLGGREIAKAERPPCNLVFLVDVSGSMNSPDKLPLVQQSLKKLAGELGPKDRIAMVVYAGSSGIVLESTPGSEREAIVDAIDRLRSGGSTNGGAGVRLAYATAVGNFIEGGANRVVLCTDGDFNVGTTNTEELADLVVANAQSGVFLTVLGFGRGNLNDEMMEEISNRGNGNYAYIDSLGEAQRVLVEQAGGTLVTIAKDVKIQVEFNPAQVQAWRLVGYRNRLLAHRDFNDDTKDAGEIGAGHQVTALYEVVPVGVDMGDGTTDVDGLKYAQAAPPKDASGELLTVKLRYKQPGGDTSRLVERAVVDGGSTIMQCSDDFIFAASVASFGMLMRPSETGSVLTPEAIRELAAAAAGKDSDGRRAEFVQLVDKFAEIEGGVAMK